MPNKEFIAYYGDEILCFYGINKKDAFNNATPEMQNKVKTSKHLRWQGNYWGGWCYDLN